MEFMYTQRGFGCLYDIDTLSLLMVKYKYGEGEGIGQFYKM